MTYEQRKVYEDKIDNLVAEKSRAYCDIETVDASLVDYYKELKAIEEKYDYHTKYTKLNNYKRQFNKARRKIITVKLQYICHMIQDLLDSKFFYTDKAAMTWLASNFQIICSCNDQKFQKLYEEIISSDDFDYDDWEYDEDEYHGYSIFHEWYWRYEDDGWVRVIIPENIVNNINSFISNFDKGIEEIKLQRDKAKIEAEEKANAEQYKLYLELKQRFGD